MHMKRILLAEDEPLVALYIKDVIEELGHDVILTVYTGRQAVEQTLALHPDIALLDINMEYNTAGIDACRSIKEKHPEIKVYFLTAYSKNTFDNELKDVQYDGYIEKIDFEDAAGNILNV